jgi:DNA-binding response OmpR family regulator
MRSRLNSTRLLARQIASAARKTVLVIEHDQSIRSAVAEIFEAAGHAVIACLCEEEAIEQVHSNSPHMVVAEMNLAGQSGLDICRHLREQPGMQDVPWIFLSGWQGPDIIRRTHDSVAAYYLRKPFDPDVLLELVENALGVVRAEVVLA